MVTGIEIPQVSKYSGPYIIEEETLMGPLVNRSMLRQTGLYPIKTIAKPEDLLHYYWKTVEDLNLNYSLEPFDSPLSHMGLQAQSTNIPVIHGKMHFGYDEAKRADRTKLSSDQRIIRAASNMALEEERITLSGSTQNGLSIPAPSDTTNASTAITSALNVTTYALLASTLNAAIDQFWTNNIDPKRQPLKMVVSGDVYSKIKALLNTNGDKTGLELVREILNIEGGPGSDIYRTKYFLATVSTDAKKIKTANPTVATQKAALFAVSDEYYEVVASPIEVRTGGMDPIKGQDYQFLERWIPIYKTNKAIIYDSTVTIA